MSEETQEKKIEFDLEKFSIPISIIIAGIIIGGAVIYNGGGGKVAEAKSLYVRLAEEVGVDEEDFLSCTESRDALESVQEDTDEGIAALTSVPRSGTPFFIVVNGNGDAFPFSGALDYDSMTPIIEDAIETSDTGESFGNNNSKAASGVRPTDDSDYVQGDRDAKVSIIEYSDFQCPFCQRVHPTVERVLGDYEGDVKWVYRHLPLTSKHPEALPAAIAAECVGRLGGNDAFWQYTGALFDNQQLLGT